MGAWRPCRRAPARARGAKETRTVLPAVSALSAFGVVGDALPVDHHAGFVADDAGVATRRGEHEVAGPELHLLTVIHDDLHAPGDEVAHMGGLAAVGLGDRLDVRGPFPAGFERRATDGCAGEVDQLHLAHAGLEGPDLVG